MPPQPIPGITPGFGSTTSPYGVPGSLIRSAREIPNISDVHWQDGISFTSGLTQQEFIYGDSVNFGCGVPCSWPYCNDDEYQVKKSPDERLPVTFNPSFAYLPWRCDWKENTVGHEFAREEMDNEAQARLMAGVGSQMAKTLWFGETCHGPTGNESFPSLSLPTAAVNLLENLAEDVEEDTEKVDGAGLTAIILGFLLQPQLFWECSGGMFPMFMHMNPLLFQFYKFWTTQVGDTYIGPNGATVIADPGYSIFNPGSGEIELGLYVSGPIEYAIGNPRVITPDDNVRQNTYEVLVEVPFIYRFDPCCVFGVTTTLAEVFGAISDLTSE